MNTVVCECPAPTECGCGSTTWRLGCTLVPSPVAVDSPLHDSHQVSSVPSPESVCVEGGKTPVGGLGAAEPTGASLPGPGPPCPARSRPHRRRQQSGERTAARGAHGGGGSAPCGARCGEPSGGRGRPRGGRSGGRALETPGAPGHARLVSAAAGCREPGSGRRDPVVLRPLGLVRVRDCIPAALSSCASLVLVLRVSAVGLSVCFPCVCLSVCPPLFTVLPCLFLISPVSRCVGLSCSLSIPVSLIVSLSLSLFLDCLSLRS